LIAIQRDSKPLLNMAIDALTQIFDTSTPFLRARVMDILFDGVAIDCSASDESFLVKSTCVQLKEKDGIKSINDTHLAFSIFGGVSYLLFSFSACSVKSEKSLKNLYVFYPFLLSHKANASSVGRFTVYRGVQDISKLGEIVTFNGEEEVDVWDGECNAIKGTDSTMYV
jgi:hypothetical protein